MSDATKLEFIKNLPGIITALGAAIAAILGVVLIRKIDHIKQLTNSSMTEARTEIKDLKEAITTTADVRLRELEDENLRLKSAQVTTTQVTSTSSNGPVSPVPVEVVNAPADPANVKISESDVKIAVEKAEGKE